MTAPPPDDAGLDDAALAQAIAATADELLLSLQRCALSGTDSTDS